MEQRISILTLQVKVIGATRERNPGETQDQRCSGSVHDVEGIAQGLVEASTGDLVETSDG